MVEGEALYQAVLDRVFVHDGTGRRKKPRLHNGRHEGTALNLFDALHWDLLLGQKLLKNHLGAAHTRSLTGSKKVQEARKRWVDRAQKMAKFANEAPKEKWYKELSPPLKQDYDSVISQNFQTFAGSSVTGFNKSTFYANAAKFIGLLSAGGMVKGKRTEKLTDNQIAFMTLFAQRSEDDDGVQKQMIDDLLIITHPKAVRNAISNVETYMRSITERIQTYLKKIEEGLSSKEHVAGGATAAAAKGGGGGGSPKFTSSLVFI